MRRVTFKSVLDRVAGLLQGLPSVDTSGVRGMDVADVVVAQRNISSVTREFWERYAWPELCPTEKRFLRPVYVSANPYVAGAEVWFWGTQGYYQALKAVIVGQAPATVASGVWSVNSAYWAEATEVVSGELGVVSSNSGDWIGTTTYVRGQIVRSYIDGSNYQCIATTSLNEEPSANLSKWGLRTDFVRSLDLEQAGQTAMSGVRRVWDCDPQLAPAWEEACHRQNFEVFDGEVVVRGSANVLWVQFWKVCPEWIGTGWVAATVYGAGTVVYWTDGDFYRCVTTTAAGESPGTTPGKWLRLDYPLVLAEMVAWRVFGEMDPLHGEGPMGDGISMAEGIFGSEVMKLERQMGQTRQINVLTRT